MRLSHAHVLRGFVITLCCALLLVAVPDARGQAGTPTAPSASGQVASAIEQTNAILQQQGAERVFTVLIIVLVLVIAWVTVRPTINNNTASNTAIIQSSNQFLTLARDFQTSNTASLEVSRKAAEAISENTHTLFLLNKAIEALPKQLTTEREAGVNAVNDHVNEQHAETRKAIEAAVAQIEERVDKALEKFDEIMPRIDERLKVWDDTIRITLLDIHNELVASKQAARDVKADTGKLRTQPADPADPAAALDDAPKPDAPR